MLISVIVPVYNAEKYLEMCAQSVLTQSYKELELILVDDGSKDKSPMLCDEIADTDKRVRVIHQANSGVSGARNTGINAAEGEYIAFVDNDDILPPKALETFVKAIGEDKPLIAQGKVFVTNSYENTWEDKLDYDELRKSYVKPYDFVMRSGVNKTDVWGKLYHKSVAKKYSFPLGHYGEDLYFNGMVLSDECLDNVLVVDNVVYVHVDNSESASHKWSVDDFVDISTTVNSLYEAINKKNSSAEMKKVYYKLTFTQFASCKYNIILRKGYKGKVKAEMQKARAAIVKKLSKSELSIKEKAICYVLASSNTLYRAYILHKDPSMKNYEKYTRERQSK